MGSDPDGSFIFLLLSTDPTAAAVKSAVFLVMLLIIIILSLFCGSVVTASQTEVRRLSDHGSKKAGKALFLLGGEEKYIRSAHAGIVIAEALYFISAQAAFYPMLYHAIRGFEEKTGIMLLQCISVVSVFLLSLVIVLLFGRSLPEKAGACSAEAMLVSMSGVFRFFVLLPYPISSFCDLLSDIMLRPSINNTKNDANRRAEEEILQMVDEGEENGVIEGNTKDMIENVLDFDDTTVGEIMTHRKDVVAVRLGTRITDAAQTAIKSGKSRLPVYGDDIDDIVGMLYVKDLLKFVSTNPPAGTIGKDILKEAVFVPESKCCSEMFEYMTENKTQIAVVVDEFGGTGGIITMEDLIESILGNIQDEYDNEAEEIERLDERSFTVSGSTSLDEISELTGLDFEDEDNDTVAGIMLDRMGHIPKAGEHPSIVINGTRFTVQQVENRRISKVLVVKAAKKE